MFNSLAVATVVVAAAAFIPQIANAERVCRQDCVGPVCQERCVETEGVGTDVKDVKTGEKTGVSCGRRGANEVPVSN
jgi:hypothetical protein